MAHRILVIRLGSLGDVVLTSAPVLNLKLAFPDSHLTFLTKQQYASVAGLFTGVDEVVAMSPDPSVGALARFVSELDRARFDLVVDLHGNFRSWLTRRLLTSGQSVVYPKRRLQRWLTAKRWQHPENPPHTIDLYNSALAEFDVADTVARPVIAARSLPTLQAGQSGGKCIVLAPGAAHSTKQWPTDRFLHLARLLSEELGVRVYWVAQSSGRMAESARSRFSTDQLTELLDLPYPELADVLAQASLVISNDSGLMHLASAVGTPVLAIFGPTHPNLGFAPRGQFDQIVQVEESCRPCSLHGKKPCVRSEQFCFTRILPEQVYELARKVLERNLQRAMLFDRDGTLMVDKHYLADPHQVELVTGALEALSFARSRGYRLVVLSNQSGVARGLFGPDTVERVHHRFEQLLLAEGARVDAIHFCPHYRAGSVPEFARACRCRKPYPGMAESAAETLGLNLRQSVVIGDKQDDLDLALAIGATPILVRTGHGRATETRLSGLRLYQGIPVCDSVAEAVQCMESAIRRDQSSRILP